MYINTFYNRCHVDVSLNTSFIEVTVIICAETQLEKLWHLVPWSQFLVYKVIF